MPPNARTDKKYCSDECGKSARLKANGGSYKRTTTPQKPEEGESLADLYPDLASEWDPTLNGDLSPYDLKTGSHMRVWWKLVNEIYLYFLLLCLVIMAEVVVAVGI